MIGTSVHVFTIAVSARNVLSSSAPHLLVVQVRFRFSASSIGSASLQFMAEDGEGATDSLQLELEVQGELAGRREAGNESTQQGRGG